MESLALKLFEISAFKFGDFKMKVGINSPVYFDLRVIVSFPEVMNQLTDQMKEFIEVKKIKFDHYCGVPYTALPLATLLSVKSNHPMLIRRKEAKAYGTKKLIEGKFSVGEHCLIIEDVVTSGSSILETVNDLRGEGITVSDAIVVVDREQGGVQNTEEKGVKMHSLFTLSYLLNILLKHKKIEESTVKAVAKYIAACQIRSDGSFMKTSTKVVNDLNRINMSYGSRAGLAKNEVAKSLFEIMEMKKTNLCLAVDLTKSEEILNMVEKVGPYICLLKTHVDIVEDFNERFVDSLKSLAQKHNFMVMEDRKFADIGNTVSLQYSSGLYKISNWADLVTVHSLPGQGILKGLKSTLSGVDSKKRGCFLLAEFSCEGNLITPQYSSQTLKMATESPDVDFIAGVVAQNKETVPNPGLLQLTPGCKIEEGVDNLGQKYNSPEYVIKEKGADIAVVGRGILSSKNPEETAQTYRDRLWNAYTERISNDDK